VEQGEELSRILLHSIKILNFDIKLARAAFGGMLTLTLGASSGRNIYVNTEKAALRCGIWVQNSAFDIGSRKITEKT
jgi:outer membrane protein TolC